MNVCLLMIKKQTAATPSSRTNERFFYADMTVLGSWGCRLGQRGTVLIEVCLVFLFPNIFWYVHDLHMSDLFVAFWKQYRLCLVTIFIVLKVAKLCSDLSHCPVDNLKGSKPCPSMRPSTFNSSGVPPEAKITSLVIGQNKVAATWMENLGLSGVRCMAQPKLFLKIFSVHTMP